MIDQQYKLQVFRPDYGQAVAGWVVSRQELFLVAPRTSPPLTPEKVCAWTAGPGRGYIYLAGCHEPIAYGELNPMPNSPADLWVGHLLVAPQARGCYVGRHFLRELLDLGFGYRRARSVCLVVFPDNQAAIRCYRGSGFVDAGSQRQRFPGSLRRHELRFMRITREQFVRSACEGSGRAAVPVSSAGQARQPVLRARAARMVSRAAGAPSHAMLSTRS